MRPSQACQSSGAQRQQANRSHPSKSSLRPEAQLLQRMLWSAARGGLDTVFQHHVSASLLAASSVRVFRDSRPQCRIVMFSPRHGLQRYPVPESAQRGISAKQVVTARQFLADDCELQGCETESAARQAAGAILIILPGRSTRREPIQSATTGMQLEGRSGGKRRHPALRIQDFSSEQG